MTKTTRWIAGLLAAGCATGCAVADDEQALETDTAEIRGGVVTDEPGVVAMWIGGSFCTASLIADDTLVTARHCKSTPDPLRQPIRVVERDAATGRYRCLTARTSVLGPAGGDMQSARIATGCETWQARFVAAAGWAHLGDFMVMRLDDGRWYGKTRDQYVRLLASGTLAATAGMHADTPDDTFTAIGTSSLTFGTIKPRAAQFQTAIDAPEFMNLDATITQGMCSGDSGGPLGFRNVFDLTGTRPRYTVAGVAATAAVVPDPGCVPNAGDPQTWTRISPHISLVTGLLGRSCRSLVFLGAGASSWDCDTSNACVGATPPVTDWQVVDADTIAVDVDTSSCGSTTTPRYFPTLLGTSHHWRAMGTTSVYAPTATGFRVLVTDRAGPVTPAQANARGWRIGWQAIRPVTSAFGSCSGTTPLPTAWQTNAGPGGGIYLDVDTTACGLGATPFYTASLRGAGLHDRTTGVTSIYDAGPTGFRIYLHGQDGVAPTPTLAAANAWRVDWLATPAATVGNEYCAGMTPATGWTQVTGPGGSQGVTRTIDLASCGLQVTPRILASLGGSTMQWNTTGVTSIYNVTPTSFQVFVFDESGPVNPDVAAARGWAVRWAVRR